MAKLKCKVGDKVKITANISGHYFSIGDIVEICKVDSKAQDYNARNAKASWFITDADCELATQKPVKQMANTNTADSTRKALVLACAQTLLKANNTCTTLEIKTELRKTQSSYYWTQQVVSDMMDEFSKSGVFTWTDNGTFRTYSDPSRQIPASTRVTKSKTGKRTATRTAKTTTKKWATSSTISRRKALKLMMNNKGHFFTVVFTKKEDGSERTMNCQYLAGQTTGTGYVKVKEASLVRAKDPNPIRQFALDSVKILSIAGNTHKIR